MTEVDPVAAVAAARDELELPEAKAIANPPIVAARATAIAAIVIRGCRMIPHFRVTHRHCRCAELSDSNSLWRTGQTLRALYLDLH
jgi:hypothetical protein